ncbi:hypothetical protein GCM10010399_46490 [Dactylosporangium fulvum]
MAERAVALPTPAVTGCGTGPCRGTAEVTAGRGGVKRAGAGSDAAVCGSPPAGLRSGDALLGLADPVVREPGAAGSTEPAGSAADPARAAMSAADLAESAADSAEAAALAEPAGEPTEPAEPAGSAADPTRAAMSAADPEGSAAGPAGVADLERRVAGLGAGLTEGLVAGSAGADVAERVVAGLGVAGLGAGLLGMATSHTEPMPKNPPINGK